MAEQRTLEAEQLYKSWQNEQPSRCSIPPWEQTSDAVRAEWEAIAAARRASPAMGEDSLPPLAEPTVLGSDGNIIFKGHTAEQVRQAQREAVADRPTWADVQAREKDIRALQSEVIELRTQFARQSAPEGAPVAWAVTAPKGGIHKLSITRDSAERKAARWREEWPDNACQVRPLVFGDAAPTSASAQPLDQNKMENNDE